MSKALLMRMPERRSGGGGSCSAGASWIAVPDTVFEHEANRAADAVMEGRNPVWSLARVGVEKLTPRGSGILSFLSRIPILGALFKLLNTDTLNNPDSYAGYAVSNRAGVH